MCWSPTRIKCLRDLLDWTVGNGYIHLYFSSNATTKSNCCSWTNMQIRSTSNAMAQVYSRLMWKGQIIRIMNGQDNLLTTYGYNKARILYHTTYIWWIASFSTPFHVIQHDTLQCNLFYTFIRKWLKSSSLAQNRIKNIVQSLKKLIKYFPPRPYQKFHPLSNGCHSKIWKEAKAHNIKGWSSIAMPQQKSNSTFYFLPHTG